MRQVEENAKLKTLEAPKLTTVTLPPEVRALALARLIAPAAARIAPSLPCR